MVSSAFRATAVPFVAGVLLLAPASTVPQARPAALDDATIVHVLDRTGFGARAEDVARVRELGLDRYLDEQLHPERLSDAEVRARLAGFQTLALDSSTIAERYYAPLLRERRASRKDDAGKPADAADAPGRTWIRPSARAAASFARPSASRWTSSAQQKILRAVYSPRQLEEVLVDFWFNHFNVFAGKGPVRGYLTEYERDAIRPHVLGRFRDLLGAVAKSPAMLFYLDNWQSVDPQAAEDMTRRLDRIGDGGGVRGRIGRRRLEQRTGAKATPEAIAQIKQRMPRGLNENYARELMELHTLGVAGGYTQADVVEVARAFTGWTIRGPRQGGGYAFDARRHAKGPKTVLGTTIDAGGEGDGEAVLDLLAAHPSTATFIATKLARRFVADEPPPALVKRAAATFTSSRGDLRAVVRTILTSPEFLSAEARRAKVKTPFEFAVSALRVTRAEVADASAVVQQVRALGMPLYFAQPPTGYADTRRRVGQHRRAGRPDELRGRPDGESRVRRARRSRRADRNDRRRARQDVVDRARAPRPGVRRDVGDAGAGHRSAVDCGTRPRIAGVPAPLTYAVSATFSAARSRPSGDASGAASGALS